MFLSDPQWLLLQPLLSPSTTRGRPSSDNRRILEAILWKIATRKPWYDIPSASFSWQTCYQHYHRWQHTGIWISILKILLIDLRDRGGFNLIELWDCGQLSIKQDDSGHDKLSFPPEFKDTWKLSTASLILCAFANSTR